MKLTVGTGFNHLAGLADQFVNSDPGLRKALGDSELSIGLASEAGTPKPA